MFSVGGCAINFQMEIKDADDQYCKMHFVEQSGVKGNPIHECIHIEDVNRFVQQLKSTSDSPYAIKYRTKQNKNKSNYIVGIVNKQDMFQKFNIITLNLSDILLKDQKISVEHMLHNWSKHPNALSKLCGTLIGQVHGAHLDDFSMHFGTNYFEKNNICDRIDFLYKCSNFDAKSDEHENILKKCIDIYKIYGILCVKSKTRRHNKCRILILTGIDENGLKHYSIRQFMHDKSDLTPFLLAQKYRLKRKPTFDNIIKNQCCRLDSFDEKIDVSVLGDKPVKYYTFDSVFWNFKKSNHKLEGVAAYPSIGGFCDSRETKSMADLIILTTNLLGFKST